jgi:hypothetical protein
MSSQHGVYDIENQTIPLNPRFVFHASCGFEAGGHSEFNKVKAFIARRSKNKPLNDRIHIIWQSVNYLACVISRLWHRYYIPMDEDNSFFTERIINFSLSGTLGVVSICVYRRISMTHLQSSVLVIMLFAKFDALYDDARAELISMGISRERCSSTADAREISADGLQLRLWYTHRKGNRRSPKCHTCIARKLLNLLNWPPVYMIHSRTFRYG